MKNLLATIFAITVFLNSGKILYYPTGDFTTTTGGYSPLVGADSPDTILNIWRNLPENDGKFRPHEKLLASVNLRSVEHWETK